jgi:hypothetical protein
VTCRAHGAETAGVDRRWLIGRSVGCSQNSLATWFEVRLAECPPVEG